MSAKLPHAAPPSGAPARWQCGPRLFPRRPRAHTENEPTSAKLPHAAAASGAPPRWQCGLRRLCRRGSASGGVDFPYRQKPNGHATSERGAAPGESSPTCTKRHVSRQAERRPSAAKQRGDAAGRAESDLISPRRSRPGEHGGQTPAKSRAKGRPEVLATAPPLPLPAPRSYARRETGSDVHEQTKSSRRCCGDPVGTDKETPRSGRGSGAMRHRRRAFAGVVPRVWRR